MKFAIGSQSVLPTEADIDAVMLEFVHIISLLLKLCVSDMTRTRSLRFFDSFDVEMLGWQTSL